MGNGNVIAVIGAGVAGLAAAGALRDAGATVEVVDKGRSVGGRLATRRIGAATLDHGAPHVAPDGAGLGDLLGELEARGLARMWADDGDGRARYVVDGGMNQLAKRLARGLDATVGTEIESVGIVDGRWLLTSAGSTMTADAVVLTPPVPQSLALLDAGGVALPPDMRDRLAAIEYHRVLVLLVVLDAPPGPGLAGRRPSDDGPFRVVVDNQATGVSAQPALSLHVRPEVSRQRWHDDPDALLERLLGAAHPWLGGANVVASQVKRWRYAEPCAPLDGPIDMATVAGCPLVVAGDAFAGGGVEGAHRSGRAAAAHLLADRPEIAR